MTLRALPPADEPVAHESAELAVPARPPSRDARVRWLAELVASGRYQRHLAAAIAQAWGLAQRTVENDIEVASKIVIYSADDVEGLRRLCATRLENLAGDMSLEPRDRIRAIEVQARLAGLLKGGPDQAPPTPAELERQMVEAIRNPDEMMARWLRAALSEPGQCLRAVLAEFSTIEAHGVEAEGDP